MQKLEVFQSLWAMEMRHPDLPERSDRDSFAMIKEAGFDGVCIDLGADEIDSFRDKKIHFEENQLRCMVNAFPYQIDDFQPLLSLAKEFDTCLINVIGGVMPIAAADAVPVLQRWIDEANKVQIPVLFETHRDSTLNDLFYTLQVLDLMPELRLCADLSHVVINREFWTPISDRDQAYIDRILERSDCFQGRIASREQIQIQIDFPQHQDWVAIFKSWWKQGMRRWRQRNDEDATLVFLCELGPPSYAITDAKGYELSDRWQEALTIKGWAETLWEELEQEMS